jgi:pyridoxal phosphate enzyme (YggS family)
VDAIALRLKTNWREITQAVADAAGQSGRAAESVRIVAVTKGADIPTTQLLVDIGCRDLGESRPQQIWEKASAITHEPPIRWHLIGHLQRNKIRRTLPLVAWIHSIDSVRLLESLDQSARELEQTIDGLLEVNPGADQAKTGVPPRDLPALLDAAQQCQNIRVRGLMAMASQDADPQQARREFDSVRMLRDSLASGCSAPHSLDELSMGMSDDFSIAIAAGATIVRIGSRLFAGLPPAG